MTTLYRKDLGAPEDFTESRNIVCMIDRVCCVMYRCNYELLISPYNLFHPNQTHYNPSSLLKNIYIFSRWYLRGNIYVLYYVGWGVLQIGSDRTRQDNRQTPPISDDGRCRGSETPGIVKL